MCIKGNHSTKISKVGKSIFFIIFFQWLNILANVALEYFVLISLLLLLLNVLMFLRISVNEIHSEHDKIVLFGWL